ncbi:hypothetical protein IMF23_00420 [Chelatococcus daeguensis]|uniref:CobQ/CobB/MinD/ParA nucleotide binding domain-containing protein n=2 Tax=Chelatococcus TaxID=28209 RepID=A0AAC9JNW5_9HYPH|nr:MULTISPECIES: hypothetical protein [Chelatococcus]APF36220.1 hypothetical protein BOQ54_01825 [Chelatococcus daeguensis]KZE30750.1 hypothetical protein AVW15_02425 [Chelatococcus daeguensis]MBM3081890.1 hypothetical protein [Chelatococcus daeguensis]CUA89146.1 hypothetical protein Ga0061061_106244 [Chelatococcus sambhunathii]
MKHTVILVGADKGGVGKTTTCRGLLDYLIDRNILPRAFDTETPRGTLQRFHPDITEIVDLSLTAGQMRIIDTLSRTDVKASVVDVRAGQMGRTLAALRDMGFLEAVAEKRFNFIVLHVLGPSIASLDEIAETAPFTSDAQYFLVKNKVNDTTFFDWSPSTSKAYFGKVKCAGEITIPKLNEMAYEQVELAGTSFSTFIADKSRDGEEAGHSFVLRGYVRSWLRSVCAEFDRVHFADIMTARPAKRA